MRKLVDAEITLQTMKLQQMGAKVQVISSKMCYVKFDISGFQVEYAYNVNKHGNYFLERIAPYPLPLREFDREDAVIDIIEIDLEQFKNAIKSHNIESFININRKLTQTIKRFEDLFLYFNVPAEETDIIYAKLQEIDLEIEKTKQNSKRLYFKKEPENL
jgi:hypothetical protein